MPFRNEVFIACRPGQIELVTEVIEPHGIPGEAFAPAVQNACLRHQWDLMTDPALLSPPDLKAYSVIQARDPFAPEQRQALAQLGYDEQQSHSPDGPSLFARIRKRKRTHLDRWRLPFLRADATNPWLAALETEALHVSTTDPASAAAHFVRQVATAGLELSEDIAGLRAFERHVLQSAQPGAGRTIIHPALVREIVAFWLRVAEGYAAKIEATDDDEAPILFHGRAQTVATDPEFRVLQFVQRGHRALLSDYLEDLARQANHQPQTA